MKISDLFEFPGILIVIGVIFLIIAFVVGLLAYKKKDKVDFDVKKDESVDDDYKVESIKLVDDEVIEQAKNVIKENETEKVEEAEVVDQPEAEEEDFLETKEFINLNPDKKDEKQPNVETL